MKTVISFLRIESRIWRMYQDIRFTRRRLTKFSTCILVWPWPPLERFIVPVLPLILLAIQEGFQRIPPSPRLLCVTATIASVIVVVSAIAGGYFRLTNVQVQPSLHRYEWILNNTAPGDVIACMLDPNCYLYTGRKAVSIAIISDWAPFYGSQRRPHLSAEKLAEMVRTSNAAYVMVEPMRNNIQAALAREALENLQRDSPGQLEEVWYNESEEATIYRVRDVMSAKGTPLSLR